MESATPPGSQDLDEEDEHELLSCIIILEKFDEELTDIGVDPHEVCGYIFGVSIKGEEDGIWQRKVAAELISSSMDVDRLDYVTRDNQMTGADVANIDVQRMVRSYGSFENSLVLSDKALSAIGNYLDGRLAVYKWINQHHKVIYADSLLKEAVKELHQTHGENIISLENVIDECVGDDFLMESLRTWSSGNPGTQVAELYRQFRDRDFLSSCWKHRLGYENELSDDAFDELDDIMDGGGRDEVEEALINELNLDDHELWVRTSYIPEYSTSDLRKIYIQYNDNKYSVESLNMYNTDPIYEQTPYVFAPEDRTREVIDTIEEIM